MTKRKKTNNLTKNGFNCFKKKLLLDGLDGVSIQEAFQKQFLFGNSSLLFGDFGKFFQFLLTLPCQAQFFFPIVAVFRKNGEKRIKTSNFKK